MKNKEGYTIPELIVVAVLLGIFSIVTINKVSYAFLDTKEMNEKSEEMVISKSASIYGNDHKNDLKEEKTKYVLGKDLIEAGYLADIEDYKNIRVKLEYVEATDSVSAEIMK